MSKGAFLFTKWYLDCVAENGDTAILYVADLRWNTVSVHYGSLLTVVDGKIGFASSLHGSASPGVDGEVICVHQPGLNTEGTWQSLRAPVQRTVFESPRGSVDWNCLQPMSQVDLRTRGNFRISGLGYAECLTLSILPWHLPLTSLNWGRYLSPQDAVAWIDWRGADPWGSVIHNGEEHHADSATESEIVFADGRARLHLDQGLVLRKGQLGDTIFPGISRLAGLLPRSLLNVHECKWRSRGVFRCPLGESSGWVIHEVVKWKD